MAFNNYMPMPQYGQYNALAPYQQRLDMMQQQYGGMQPQQPMQQMQQQQPFVGIKGKPVVSEDEARNTIIDMDGSTFFFPDFANNCIYSKQMNPETFAPIFRVYKIAEAQPAKEQPQIDTSGFVPRTDFDALSTTVASLQEQIQQAVQTAPKRNGKEESK